MLSNFLTATMDKELVKHIAELARIELTEKEEELFAGQLQSVLDYFELLQDADVNADDDADINAETDPPSSLCGATSAWQGAEKKCNTEQTRLDKQDSLDRDFDRDVLLDNVPEMEGGAVKVKGVF